MRYKAIFFDFDGTLRSFVTHAVPASAIEAVRLAQARDVKVFLATGRHPDTVNSAPGMDSIAFDGVLAANGQFCYDAGGVIHRMYISREDKESLVRYLTTERVPVLFMGERQIFINFKDERVARTHTMLRSIDAPALPPEACLSQEIYSLLMYEETDAEIALMRHLPGCKAVRWHPSFVDIIPAAGGKRVGMDAVLARYGIGLDETMAFGDAQNDVGMITHAALGIAMGNATGPLLAVADYVTDSVDDNGVYNALKHFGVI